VLSFVQAVHIHHHFHGYAPGYIGLAAAALASWAGFPGPGEAALVAAAVVAARGHLDIVEVTLVAWGGATAGGVVGWLLGRRGGRAVIASPGPFRRARRRALDRGERFYARYGTLAVFLTPAWMAGVSKMPWTRFVPANVVSALVWALTIGVGGYFAGPPVVDVFQNVGLAVSIAIAVALVAGGSMAEWMRRRRRRASS
jgi:membrane protein DedA with SNARE-associated domain